MLLISILIIIIAAMLILKRLSKKNPDYMDAVNIMFIPLIIIFVAIIAVVGYSSAAIWDNVQEINVINKKVVIYEQQKITLVEQYKSILDTTYIKYESGVFDKVTSAISDAKSKNVSGSLGINIQTLPNWPDTKVLESLKELVSRIDTLNKSIYNLQIKKQDLIAEAKSYKSGIFIPTFLQPNIPDYD